ncbi:MAG: hypothetical protein K2Q34_08700 [Alphaproteobacteria bacterium]|nr:hypothetical protein [Alphaproteobacteria bacterium]
MMHEKEDVVCLNKSSYFQKIVSSIVLVSFLSMTIGQSYAMTENLELIQADSRHHSSTGKVAPAPAENENGDVELGTFAFNITKHVDPRKVVPIGEAISTFAEKLPLDESSANNPPKKSLLGGPPSEDQEDDECKDEKTKAATKEAMRSGINSEDLKKIGAAGLLTLILGTGLWGLMELWINSVINAVDTTKPGYKYTYETREGAQVIDEIILAQRVNIALAFSSFFFYRALRFADRLLPSTAVSDVTRKFGYYAEIPGEVTALGFSLFTAASSGFELYTSLIGYSKVVAGVTTGFFVPLTVMDYYLRYAELKDSTFNFLFVDNAERLAHFTAPKDQQSQIIRGIHDDEQNKQDLERFFASRKKLISKEAKDKMFKRWEKVKEYESKGFTIKQAKRLLEKENSTLLSSQEKATLVKELRLSEEESKLLETTTRDSLSVDKQATLAAEEDKKSKALEFRRTRNKGLSFFISALMMAGTIYYGFKGSKESSESGFKLTVPGGTKNAANEIQLELDTTRYNIFRDETAPIRRGNLTDVYIPSFNITRSLNIEALLNWCKPCLNGVIWKSLDVNATTGEGTGEGSMGDHCDGVPFEADKWTFSLPQDKQVNIGTCAAWNYWIDRQFAIDGKVKDENTDDYYTNDDDSVSISVAAEGTSNLIGGVEAVAGGLLTIKTTSKTVGDIFNSFTKNPDEIIPGKHNLLMNTGVFFTSLTESLIYATPAAIAAWISTRGSKTPSGVNWWFTASKYASSTLNVLPDFSDIYTRIPLDLMGLYYNTHVPQGVANIANRMHAHIPNGIKASLDYISSGSGYVTGVLSWGFGLSEQDYIRNQMIKMVSNMAYRAAVGTPEFRAALIETLGFKDKVRARRRGVIA